MKQLFLIVALTINFCAFSQDDKTVTLVVSGQGKTQDEAKQNALRSAIEQAFGTFISSKTEILNDDLVKDEVVSVANGSIQKFDVISEVQIPDEGYAATLKATVSVTRLTSFVESKGIIAEFKGNLFAFNVNQKILNEQNEIKAIEDLCSVVSKISDVSFDYSINVSEPIAINSSNNNWRIPIIIGVSANNNFLRLVTYLHESLKGLSLSIEEANDYLKLGKKVYPISLASNENDYNYLILRTDQSLIKIIDQLYYFNHSLQNFKISNGLSSWKISNYPDNLKSINDNGFKIFIKMLHSTPVPTYGSVFNYVDRIYEVKNGPNPKNIKLRSEFPFDLESEHPDRRPKPILDHTEYKIIASEKEFNFMRFRSSSTFMLKSYQTFLPRYYSNGHYFTNQFAFVWKFENENLIKDSTTPVYGDNLQPGLVISFIGIKPKKEIVRFYYEDVKSLKEINEISKYEVSPIRY